MRSSFRFCVPALALALCGCPTKVVPPPPPPGQANDHPNAVTLEVQQGWVQGFVPTYGANGQPYSYRYSDGDDRHGNVKVKQTEGHDVKIHINLSSSNFAINEVDPSDPTGQITNTPPTIEGNGRKATITDQNTDTTLDAYYALKVLDNSQTPAIAVFCDPRIVNN